MINILTSVRLLQITLYDRLFSATAELLVRSLLPVLNRHCAQLLLGWVTACSRQVNRFGI